MKRKCNTKYIFLIKTCSFVKKKLKKSIWYVRKVSSVSMILGGSTVSAVHSCVVDTLSQGEQNAIVSSVLVLCPLSFIMVVIKNPVACKIRSQEVRRLRNFAVQYRTSTEECSQKVCFSFTTTPDQPHTENVKCTDNVENMVGGKVLWRRQK